MLGAQPLPIGFGDHIRNEDMHRIGIDRAAEQIALDLMAAFLPEDFGLRLILDPFRQRFHAQRIGQRRDRADHRIGVAPQRQVTDKALVDLELVEGEGAQIAERGIAGAEIVERDADAERAQAVQGFECLFDIGDEDAFGDFEFKPVRWQPR
jgi:hypothetical protein